MHRTSTLFVTVGLSLILWSPSVQANDADELVLRIEKLLALQRQVSRDMADLSRVLERITDTASASVHRQVALEKLQTLISSIEATTEQVRANKKRPLPKVQLSPSEHSRFQTISKEYDQQMWAWLTQIHDFDQALKQTSQLSLPASFWRAMRRPQEELKLVHLSSLEWYGRSAPEHVLDYHKEKIEMLQRHGVQEVIDLHIETELGPQSRAMEAELKRLAGKSAKVIKLDSPLPGGDVLTIAPVPNFHEFAASITTATVTGQHPASGVLQISLDQSGAAVSLPTRGVNHGDIQFELRGFPNADSLFACLRALWRDDTTGRFLEARSQGGTSRGKIKYSGSVQAFADQITFGTVQSVSESNRTIVIEANPAKLNPSWVLALLEGVKGESAAEARAELSEYTKNSKIESSVGAIEEKLGRSQRDRLRSQSRRGRPGSESADLLAAIERLDQPIQDNELTDTEIAELAEAMHNESFFDGQSRERAASILVTVNPKQISDKKIVGRVAKGYRKLVFDKAFPDGELVQGLVLWGGKHSMPYLLHMVKDGKGRTTAEVFAGLLKFETPEAAKAVARQLEDILDRDIAVEYLRRTKYFPEETVIAIAPSRNTKVTLAAIELLGEFGGRKSLSLLRRANKSRDAEVREAAELATQMVKERLKTASQKAD